MVFIRSVVLQFSSCILKLLLFEPQKKLKKTSQKRNMGYMCLSMTNYCYSDVGITILNQRLLGASSWMNWISVEKNVPFWNSGVLNSSGTVTDSLFSFVFLFFISIFYISWLSVCWYTWFDRSCLHFFSIWFLAGFFLAYSI